MGVLYDFWAKEICVKVAVRKITKDQQLDLGANLVSCDPKGWIYTKLLNTFRGIEMTDTMEIDPDGNNKRWHNFLDMCFFS